MAKSKTPPETDRVGLICRALRRAIIDGNLVVLTGIPGIGRKTAERMVVELYSKDQELMANLKNRVIEDQVVEWVAAVMGMVGSFLGISAVYVTIARLEAKKRY